MEKTERHQIKENELLKILKKIYEIIIKFKKEILYGFLIIIGIFLAGWGYISYKNLMENRAGKLLSQAISDEKIDFEKLKLISKKYKNTLAGREAELLICLKENKEKGIISEKIKLLLNKTKDPILKGILISNEIEILIEEKKFKEAFKFLEEKKDEIPRDFYLYLNGKIMEKEGKIEEAKAQYQRLYNEFPNSNLRYLAQQRMNVL